jgi:SagB-type dehydrogenase family enzyme
MSRSRETDLARLYHLNSSNARGKWPELTVDPERRPGQRRIYAGAERIVLPGRDLQLDLTLGEALARRRSRRDFRLAPLPLALLGRWLYASFGIKGRLELEGVAIPDRPFPSAGGLHPLELYVVTQQVTDLPDGIYHYDPWVHELERRRSGSFHDALAAMSLGQDMLRDTNLVVCLTAIWERTQWKYGQRGYRYVWLEAGHVGQNFYLAAAALGLATAAIGGFFDRELGRLLALPQGEEDVIYLLCAGQAPP